MNFRLFDIENEKRLWQSYKRFICYDSVLNSLSHNSVIVPQSAGLLHIMQINIELGAKAVKENSELLYHIDTVDIGNAITHLEKLRLIERITNEDEMIIRLTDDGVKSLQSGVYEGLANSSFIAYKSIRIAWFKRLHYEKIILYAE